MAVQQLPKNSAQPLPVYVSQSSFRQENQINVLFYNFYAHIWQDFFINLLRSMLMV